MTYQTWLFDLDGTLLDSIELILTSYRHTLTIHRGGPGDDDVWLAGLGTPLWEQFRTFTDDRGEIDAMMATYREHNLAHHDTMVREYPGVNAAVETLRGRARLGIVTSKLHSGAQRGLAFLGMEDWFDIVIGADDVEQTKPHPEPVLTALARLGGDPATTVFVGDSPHDMASGRAAGVRTAAALWGPFPRDHLVPHDPDHWLDHPDALTRITPA